MEFITISFLIYLIGSLPFGLIIGKTFYNKDLREYGSKNIGATNAYRVLGLVPALIIFLADAFKGSLGVWLGLSFNETVPLYAILGGIFAIVGHNWSLFLKFKGGKGVATGLGVIAMLVPKVTVIVLILWIAITAITRYVSLASVVAAFMVPVLTYYFDYAVEYLYFAVFAAMFVIYKHKENIYRLINGTELKINSKKSKK